MIMPSFRELSEGAKVISLNIKTRFRGINKREIMLLSGPNGWSEFSPFLEYDIPEASLWLKAAIEFAWSNFDFNHNDEILIPVNATIPAVSVDNALRIFRSFDSCSTVKIKVAELSQNLKNDIERVKAIRDFAGPNVSIRLDANGAWSLEEALRAIDGLSEFNIEYFEQPCMNVDDLLRLKSLTGFNNVKIAADESIRKNNDLNNIISTRAADIIIIKHQPLGGISQVLKLLKGFDDCYRPEIVVSSALESSIGISAGAILAHIIKNSYLSKSHDLAHGLGTVNLFTEDITLDPLIPVNGFIKTRRVTPHKELLQKYSVSKEKYDWWHNRLLKCYDFLKNNPHI